MDKKAATTIATALKETGINLVVSVPEHNLLELIDTVDADPAFRHIPATREEEGVGICAGAYLGGMHPALIMMSAGFLTCCNALVTVNYLSGLPLLMLVGYSGGLSEQYWLHTQLGLYTEPVLQAMRVVYQEVRRVDEVTEAIRDCDLLTRASHRPVAVVLNKDVLR
jgi:sulfopyruvate decarboxylase subunit alpha